MFTDNKYKRMYYTIIERARTRKLDSYTEKHHIIPKSLGGTNDKENLVRLTAREHFIVHKLLVKFTEGNHKKKMHYALWRMVNSSSGYRINSTEYERLRVAHSNLVSKEKIGKKRAPFSQEARKRMSEAKLGKPTKGHTQESKKKISESKRGKALGENNPFFGKTHSEETKEKLRKQSYERMIGKPKEKRECIHCGRWFAPNMLSRYHNDNCKTLLNT